MARGLGDTRSVTFRLPVSLYERVLKAARAANRSVTEQLQVAIAQHFAKPEREQSTDHEEIDRLVLLMAAVLRHQYPAIDVAYRRLVPDAAPAGIEPGEPDELYGAELEERVRRSVRRRRGSVPVRAAHPPISVTAVLHDHEGEPAIPVEVLGNPVNYDSDVGYQQRVRFGDGREELVPTFLIEELEEPVPFGPVTPERAARAISETRGTQVPEGEIHDYPWTPEQHLEAARWLETHPKANAVAREQAAEHRYLAQEIEKQLQAGRGAEQVTIRGARERSVSVTRKPTRQRT